MSRTSEPHAPLVRRIAPALAAYAAVRLLGVALLALWSSLPSKGVHTLLALRWDSLWYARIARDGYGYSVRTPAGDLHSDLAFFPLVPGLERAGHALTGAAVADVGLAVSVVASLIAAVGIFALAEQVFDESKERRGPLAGSSDEVGAHRSDGGVVGGALSTSHRARIVRSAPFVAVVLWALYPVGIVQWMAYSESLFTALTAWGLYCIQTRRWVWAGALACLAGLTRPVGIGVVLAVWLGCALAVRTADRHERRRMVLGSALAPAGLAGYVLWVAHRTGLGLSGYLDVQAGWRNGFDGGRAFAGFIADKFAAGTLAGIAAGVGLTAGVALVGWGWVACVRRRLPWPVLVYVATLVALALGARGYFGSKPRFFVPLFPLWFPLAAWLATRRSSRAVGIGLVVFALASAVFGAVWLNGSGPP